MSVWESIDELLDDNAVSSTTTANNLADKYQYQKTYGSNDDELDENELLGLGDTEDNSFGVDIEPVMLLPQVTAPTTSQPEKQPEQKPPIKEETEPCEAPTNRPVATKTEQFIFTPASLNDGDDGTTKADEEEFSLEINNFDSDDLIPNEETIKKTEDSNKTRQDQAKNEDTKRALDLRRDRDADNKRTKPNNDMRSQDSNVKSSSSSNSSSNKDSFNGQSRRPTQTYQNKSNGVAQRQQSTPTKPSQQPIFNNNNNLLSHPESAKPLMDKLILPSVSLTQPSQFQPNPLIQNNPVPFQPTVQPQLVQQQHQPFFNKMNHVQQQFQNQPLFRQQQQQPPLINGQMNQNPFNNNMNQTMNQFLNNNNNNNNNQFNPNIAHFHQQNQRPMLPIQQQPLLNQPHNNLNQIPVNSFHHNNMNLNPMMQQQFPGQESLLGPGQFQQQSFNPNMMNTNMIGLPIMQQQMHQSQVQMGPNGQQQPIIMNPQVNSYPNMMMNNNQPIINHPLAVSIVPLTQQPVIQQQPPHVFLNPQFLAKQQQAQSVSGSLLPTPQQPSKPTRSRKDLDLLLEQRLAEELSKSKESPDEKRLSREKSERLVEKDSNKSSSKPSSSSSSQSSSKTNSRDSHSNNGSSSNNGATVKRKPNENNENSRSSTPAAKKLNKSDSNTRSHNDLDDKRRHVEPEKKRQVTVVEPAPAPVEKTSMDSMVVIDDPEYFKKMEEQKRKREQLLRLKNEKRNQRILDLTSKSKGGENASTSEVLATTIDKKEKPTSGTFGSRTVITTNDPLLSTSKRGLIIQNLSVNTQEKSLIGMCSSINAKEKIMKVEMNRNEALIYFKDSETVDKFYKKYNGA